jgi:hypothetical protein
VQNPLGVPVVGSAHCGNGALLYSLAAFCGYLVDAYLATFFVVHLAKKMVRIATFLGVHRYFFWVCLATFFRIGKPHSMDFGSTSGPQFCAQKSVASPFFWVQHPAFFECNIHLFLSATSTHKSKVAPISEGGGGGVDIETEGAGLFRDVLFHKG